MRKHLPFFLLLLVPFLLIGQISNSSSEESIMLNYPFQNTQSNLGQYITDSTNEECSQEYIGNYFGAILMMDTGTSAWTVANDINVEANTQLSVQTLEFEVVTVEGEPTTFSVSFYRDDAGGGPGTQVGELQTGIVPTSITPNGAWGTSGYTIYKVVLELPVSPTLQATSTNDTRYWVGLSGAMTTEESFFIYLASSLYQQNDESYPTWISDGGVWLEYIDAGNKAEGILKISGECDVLQGCAEAPNGQFPAEPFIPSCNGFAESITPDNGALTGQYSTIEVTNGIPYIFSSSVSTDFITITDEVGNTLAVGMGLVSWTADFDGNIRFYLHLDSNCTYSDNHYRERKIQCGAPVCEDQKVFSDNLSSATDLGSWYSKFLAFDIPVGETGLILQGVEFNIMRNIQNPTKDTNFNIGFYNTVNGVPGNLVQNPTINIYDEEIIGSFISNLGNTYDVYRYVLKFESPVDLNAESKYWMVLEPLEGDILWETNRNTILGSGYALKNLPTGFNWAITPDSELVYRLICEEILNTNDLSASAFSYYPNPAKDILNITSAKTIERVDVYNLAGQQMLNFTKPINGQINIKTLTPGTYLFRVILKGGQIETFKIIKK